MNARHSTGQEQPKELRARTHKEKVRNRSQLPTAGCQQTSISEAYFMKLAQQASPGFLGRRIQGPSLHSHAQAETFRLRPNPSHWTPSSTYPRHRTFTTVWQIGVTQETT